MNQSTTNPDRRQERQQPSSTGGAQPNTSGDDEEDSGENEREWGYFRIFSIPLMTNELHVHVHANNSG